MNDDEVEPSRLLARKRGPSVVEKEAMFDAIAARVAAEARPPRRSFAPWALVLSAAALLGGVALMLRAGDPARPADDEFGARGAGTPAIELRCTPAPCARGSRMLLRVTPPPGRPNAAVFARATDGTILWYLPAPDGRMIAAQGEAWLPQAVVLNGEHRPGRYTLYAAFAAAPMSREELKAELKDGLRATPNVTLVERALEIEAAP